MLAVHDLVDELEAADIRASLDAARVNPPGVWVQVHSGGPYTLAARRYDLRLVLMVGDRDARRALDALEALYDQVAAVLPGKLPPWEHGKQLMPDGTNRPAFIVPYAVFEPTA